MSARVMNGNSRLGKNPVTLFERPDHVKNAVDIAVLEKADIAVSRQLLAGLIVIVDWNLMFLSSLVSSSICEREKKDGAPGLGGDTTQAKSPPKPLYNYTRLTACLVFNAIDKFGNYGYLCACLKRFLYV